MTRICRTTGRLSAGSDSPVQVPDSFISHGFDRITTMDHSGRSGRRILAVLLVVILSGCSTLGITPEFTSDADFPVPKQLKPHVDFWRHVYALWGRGQIAVHDDRYLDVIYQVADLPGPIQASYTRRQRDFIDALQGNWRARLQRL
jgi:membrane-bound lytic murein transglycosylase D